MLACVVVVADWRSYRIYRVRRAVVCGGGEEYVAGAGVGRAVPSGILWDDGPLQGAAVCAVRAERDRRGAAACTATQGALLRTYEGGLPSWAVWMPANGIYYRPWIRRLVEILIYLVRCVPSFG